MLSSSPRINPPALVVDGFASTVVVNPKRSPTTISERRRCRLDVAGAHQSDGCALIEVCMTYGFFSLDRAVRTMCLAQRGARSATYPGQLRPWHLFTKCHGAIKPGAWFVHLLHE
jgi:hypothetical protein